MGRCMARIMKVLTVAGARLQYIKTAIEAESITLLYAQFGSVTNLISDLATMKSPKPIRLQVETCNHVPRQQSTRTFAAP